MQIVEHSPERLVLREQSPALSCVLSGCAAVLIFGMAAKWHQLDDPGRYGMICTAFGFALIGLYFARPATFTFSRLTNMFEWSRPTLVGRNAGSTPLQGIDRVRIDTAFSDSDRLHRIVLETGNETVPLHHAYSSGTAGDFQQLVDVIRGWLEKKS